MSCNSNMTYTDYRRGCNMVVEYHTARMIPMPEIWEFLLEDHGYDLSVKHQELPVGAWGHMEFHNPVYIHRGYASLRIKDHGSRSFMQLYISMYLTGECNTLRLKDGTLMESLKTKSPMQASYDKRQASYSRMFNILSTYSIPRRSISL